MKTCPKCGFSNSDSRDKCRSCGAPIRNVRPSTAVASQKKAAAIEQKKSETPDDTAASARMNSASTNPSTVKPAAQPRDQSFNSETQNPKPSGTAAPQQAMHAHEYQSYQAPPPQTSPSRVARTCPQCGKVNLSGTSECTSCRHPFKEAKQAVIQEKVKNIGCLAVGACLCVPVVGFGIAYYYHKNGRSDASKAALILSVISLFVSFLIQIGNSF